MDNKLDLNKMAKLLSGFASDNNIDPNEDKKLENIQIWSKEFYNEDFYQNVDELLFEIEETIFKDNDSYMLNSYDFIELFQNSKVKKTTTNIKKFIDLEFNDDDMIVVFHLDKYTSIIDVNNHVEKVKESMNNNELRFGIKYIEEAENQKIEIFTKL